jgi:hypothetical protein
MPTEGFEIINGKIEPQIVAAWIVLYLTKSSDYLHLGDKYMFNVNPIP